MNQLGAIGLLLVLCCYAALAVTNEQRIGSERIVGGVTSRRHEFPHICAIELRRTVGFNEIIGAGNVINQRWILTVARNIYANSFFQNTEVICGRFDLSLPSEPTEQRIRVQSSIKHPLYVLSRPSSHDIALMRLVSELVFTVAIQPINLPVAASTPTGILTVIGWGGSNEAIIGQRLNQLHVTRVSILATPICNTYLARWNIVNTTHVCTGPTTGGVTPCDDDAGSSLIQVVGTNRLLVGMVALPQACGQPNAPGTYTRVSEFVAWINASILSN